MRKIKTRAMAPDAPIESGKAAFISCRSGDDSTQWPDIKRWQHGLICPTQEELRQLCRELLKTLGLVPPFTAWQFCHRLSEKRGRVISVEARDLGWVTAIGHLLPGKRRDRVLHDYRAPVPQQERIIYHESMHSYLGHTDPGSPPLICGSLIGDDDTVPDDGRYSQLCEWQAETCADELVRLAQLRPQLNEYADNSR